MPLNPKRLRPVLPVDAQTHSRVIDLLRDMGQTAFQGKNLSHAVRIWCEMLQEEVIIFLGIAGAMIPAGMRRLFVYLIQNRMVDCVVSTGANLFHDIHESLGRVHFQGHLEINDVTLKKRGIDRIYDVFAHEKEFNQTDFYIRDFGRTMKSRRPVTTREFFTRLGKEMVQDGAQDGIVTSAFRAQVPIYCPALADSSIGIALALEKESVPFLFDIIADVRETAYIVSRASKTGVIFLGGGTPKNFIQQTEVTAMMLGMKVQGHRYAIQVTTDAPHWGGLSGCTFEEAQSWGKISEGADTVTLYCDATIALPLLVTAVAQATQELRLRRIPPGMKQLWASPKKKRGERTSPR